MRDERKTKSQLIAELRELRDRLEETEQLSPAYQSLDENARIRDVNIAWTTMMGYTKAEVVGRWFGDFILPEDLSRFIESLEGFKAKGVVSEVEWTLVRADGSQLIVSIDEKISQNSKGTLSTHCILKDITAGKRAEKDLQESEWKFRVLSENIKAVFWISTPGLIEQIYASPVYETLWGRPLKELPGDPRAFIDSIHPEDREDYISVLEEYHAREKTYDCEYRIIKPDGEVRWIREQGFPAKDPANFRGVMTGICMDITESKQAEQALRESEEKYRTLSLNVPGMIYRADAEWSVPIMLNSKPICGFSPGDFLDKKMDWLDLIHPDDLQGVTKEGSRLAGKEMSIRQEYRIFDKEGNIRWVDDHKTSVFNDDGSFKGIYGVVYDITGRKLTRERSEFLAEMLDSSPLSVIAVDRAVKITYVNPATETLFGYEMEELLQQNPSMLTASLDSREVRKDILDSIVKRKIWRGEILVKEKNGEVFPVHVSVYRLSDAKGEIAFFVGFQEDITERKEIENVLSRQASELRHLSARLRKTREVERATIARELHDEFGQALTAVKINISRVENEIKAHGSRESVERMRETGELTDRLLEQVRDLALELRPSMLDDLGLAAALNWYIRGFIARTGIKCVLHIEGQETSYSEDRRTVLYRAIQEALTNVARHAQAKSVSVSLRFGTDNLTVEVKDDGNGFDVGDVFDMNNDIYPIGLLGMRESVEALGGTWCIQSSRSEGTCLTVTIPIEDMR